jgi:hypothetical protein
VDRVSIRDSKRESNEPLRLRETEGTILWADVVDVCHLNRRIIVDPTLINRITRLSMQRPDPQDFYPGKAMDRTLAQRLKDTYSDVKKGM